MIEKILMLTFSFRRQKYIKVIILTSNGNINFSLRKYVHFRFRNEAIKFYAIIVFKFN